MSKNSEMAREKKRMWLALIPPIVFDVILWLIFALYISGVFGFDVFRLGILPRHTRGLPGIALAPLIHQSVSHLFSNTIPILILMWCLFYFYSQIAFKSFFYLWLLSGLFTWMIGRESYHIGASGLVFAMIFFLFFSGILRKHVPLIALSLVVIFIYGSMIWSIFPFSEWVDTQISWEAHLSGAISGLIMAVVLRKQGPQKPLLIQEEGDDDDKDEVVSSSNYDYDNMPYCHLPNGNFRNIKTLLQIFFV
jgi:membrane associated rhomboid family serine protease